MSELVDPRSPWIRRLPSHASSPSFGGWLQGLIGEPPAAVAAELTSRDFCFLTRSEIRERAEVVATAEEWIDQIPSLSCAIRGIVGKVFLLKASEQYDVSHSEPCWPSWIFISAPASADAVSGLRLAENVLHEAMHLQLTEIEGQTPLVADTASRLHSPWKQEARQLQGILHGLYVFVCISKFYSHLLRSESLQDEGYGYVCRRIKRISEEMAAVSLGSLAVGLTDAGRQFLDSIQPIPAIG